MRLAVVKKTQSPPKFLASSFPSVGADSSHDAIPIGAASSQGGDA